MKKIIIIGIIMYVLGIGSTLGVQYILTLNVRVTGIEKFLQQAISQSQQAQRPAPEPSK